MITISKFDFESKDSLADYSAEEVEFLDQMHKVLTEFNDSIPEEFEGDIKAPDYTDDEMYAYSHYRQLLIEDRTKLP